MKFMLYFVLYIFMLMSMKCKCVYNLFGEIFMSFDILSIFFSFVTIIVFMYIMNFTIYYMNSEPGKNQFLIYLFIFYFFMLFFVNSSNLIGVFISWEMIGLFSFILIKWWDSRYVANNHSLQALLLNRLSDFFLFIVVCLMLSNGIMSMIIFLSSFLYYLIMSFIIKSSMFPFHHWLPSAMEGPTPVSSLLHSSTMVVAGVYLLLRFLMYLNLYMYLFLLLLSSLTFFMGSKNALIALDIKKIIAYSTVSHLSLMVINLILLNWVFSLFHMMVHAVFKSCSFIISGHSIMLNHSNQSLPSIKTLSLFNILYWILSIAILIAFPLLSLYMYKEMPLMYFLISKNNSFLLVMFLVSFMLSISYCFKVFFFLFNPDIIINCLNCQMFSNKSLSHFSFILGFFFWILLYLMLPMNHFYFGHLNFINYILMLIMIFFFMLMIKMNMNFQLFYMNCFLINNYYQLGSLSNYCESFLSFMTFRIFSSYMLNFSFKFKYYLFGFGVFMIMVYIYF